jgi:TolB protein
MKGLAVLVVALSVLGATRSAATLRKEPPRLTYAIQGRGICLAGARPAKDIRLTRPRWNVQPSWSPDGRMLAFVGHYLFVQDARGRGRPIAGDDTYDINNPAWSPNGRRIAYAAGRYGRRLLTIRPDGSGRRTITNGPFDFYPAWSPDGAFVAFAREDQVARRSSVYVAEMAGAQSRLLVEDGTDPGWSPDGRSIVFVRPVGPRQVNLFVIGVDGTGERQLTSQMGYDGQPAWSPDGVWIAFTRRGSEQADSDIALIRADGTGMRVVRGSPLSELDPTWRPAAAPRRGKGPCHAQ